MTENDNTIFLTPSHPVRGRPCRASKNLANLKIATTSDCLSPEITKSVKIQRTKSVILPKSSNIRRAKSQMVIKSKNLIDDDLENDEDEYQNSESESSSSDSESESNSSSSAEWSSDDSKENLTTKISKLKVTNENIKRSKSFANIGRKSISVPPRKRLTEKVGLVRNTRDRLLVGHVPDDLPGRQKEFDTVYMFLYSNLCRGMSGSMFVYGVPGTGKTATVSRVIDSLEYESIKEDSEVPEFRRVTINGMHVMEPRQVYPMIYQELTGRKTTQKNSVDALEKELGHSGQPVLLMIDEMDKLCNKKQDVLYRIFKWMSQCRTKVLLVTISNTMDIAERVLHQRVSSRIGQTQLSFEPYSHEQLIEIIESQLNSDDMRAYFEPNAIELAARKIAAVSGDVRQALAICRRALEVQKPDSKIDCVLIKEVINEMCFDSRFIAIKHCCSFYEKLFLKALVVTFKSLGCEEAVLEDVMTHFLNICSAENVRTPNKSEIFSLVRSLVSCHLLSYDSMLHNIKMRLRLKCRQIEVLNALNDD